MKNEYYYCLFILNNLFQIMYHLKIHLFHLQHLNLRLSKILNYFINSKLLNLLFQINIYKLVQFIHFNLF